MVKKAATKKNSPKRSKFKGFYRSKKVVKIRRFIINFQKWIEKHIKFLKKPGKNNLNTLEPIFQTSEKPAKFFTPLRLMTFMILFMGASGTYLWFHLTSAYIENSVPILPEITQTSGKDSAHNYPDLAFPIQKSPKEESAHLNKNADIHSAVFTMQPYLKVHSGLSLIKTINPQFFIEAADNKTQKVAILIVGLGINETLTEEVMEQLPKNISLVFSPYTADLEDAIEFAQYEEFAALVAAPLEDEDPVTDQGYFTLKTKVSEEENLEILRKIAFYAKDADCIYGQGGARLLRSAKELRPVLDYIRNVNNCFVTPPDIVVNRLHEVAASMELNYVCTTVENPTRAMMPSIEALTKRTGFSILAFDAKPGIVEEIKEWIQKLQQAKLSIVPITEIIHN
ncbi:divergent polysaccharide deacetylase family protein [Candidatus Paracaedibacter symbiosus]|uniref:divergent polysaccharide deacetylase family protein n=1 Tax=Candidatus Paracaedibacter symbiosus TaxID=244582 RepID=UPI000509A901|nr:divergent polysaccharide deacetylase family protein [Candidatus Paracaedibacter symbiosus]